MWGVCACAIPRAQVPAHLKTGIKESARSHCCRLVRTTGINDFPHRERRCTPQRSSCLSRSLLRTTVRSAVASSCFTGVVFPPRKRREFTRARRRSEAQGPRPVGLTYAP